MSHLFLNEDQAALRDAAYTFSRKVIEPLANKIDEEERTPPELVAKVAEQGYFGLFISEEYGGAGADLTSCCLVLEEIAKASPSFAGMLSVQMILCPETVSILGTEEQKKRLLDPSAGGRRLMAYSQTEPVGATNKSFHQTRLTPDGNAWRLNGAKLFCTQGEAKTYLVMCRTRRDGQEGYGCVIVEQEAAGFNVAPYEDKLGWRGSNTGGISFSDVLVTPENVLGDLLTGSADNRGANNASFIAHAATSLGCAQGLFEKTLQQVKDRTLYGEPMHKLSPISFRMADVYNKLQAARSLLYESSRLFDAGRTDVPMRGSICKSYICEVSYECCHILLQMWGGSGMMNSTGINRYFRDARTKLIAEGSTEFHNSLIANLVLGLA
jgi:butyryl-CoA dehydrogenase